MLWYSDTAVGTFMYNAIAQTYIIHPYLHVNKIKMFFPLIMDTWSTFDQTESKIDILISKFSNRSNADRVT